MSPMLSCKIVAENDIFCNERINKRFEKEFMRYASSEYASWHEKCRRVIEKADILQEAGHNLSRLAKRNPGQAEWLAQELLVEGPLSYKAKAYLRRMAENCLAELRRRFNLGDETEDKIIIHVVSIDEILEVDENAFPDNKTENRPEEKVLNNEEKMILRKSILTCLTPKERIVILNTYGFGRKGKEFQGNAIARYMGISPSRVTQLKERALKKLKAAMNAYYNER